MNHPAIILKKIFHPACHDRIFLLGGSVRDLLLEKDCKDIDLAAALSSDELASSGFHLVSGKTTAPVWFLHDPSFGKIELTPLPDPAALSSNLACRDFTVNAIAMDLSGAIIDPLNGRRDLELRLLRVCSQEVFCSDPLRIFRALRFESDGWRMTADTEALVCESIREEKPGKIPIERFSRELLKALGSTQPERFFQRMLELDAGRCFLPELFRYPAIPAGPLIHHPEGDLFTHSCQVLQRVAAHTDSPLSRFCAFFHDIGKLATDPHLYPKHHGHDQAGYELAFEFCDRLRLPSIYRDALAWTSRLHGKLNLWAELRDTTKIVMAGQAVKAGIEWTLPLVSSADKCDGREQTGWWDAIRVSGMTTYELGIDPARLEEIKVSKRADYILQKRVELLCKRNAIPPASPHQIPDQPRAP